MRIACSILAVLAFAGVARAQTPTETPKVTVDLLANTSAIRPGKPFTVALRFKIEPGWHLYWQNPGDTGAPPKAKWSLPDTSTAGPPQFPVPKRITVADGLTAFGYEDELVLLTTITPGKDIGQNVGKTFSIAARVSWVICRETCISEHQNVTLELPVGNGPPANSDNFIKWVSQQPRRDDDAAGRSMTVKLDPADAKRGEIDIPLQTGEKPTDFFPPSSDFAVYGKAETQTTNGVRYYRVPFTLLPGPHDDFVGTGLIVLENDAGQSSAVELPCVFHFKK